MKSSLYELEAKLSGLDLTQALNKAAIAVETKAKELCPVDTGDLRRSIRHRVEGDTAYIGSNLEYSKWQEFGTGLFAENGDGRQDVPWRYKDAEGNWHSTKGNSPQPFLRPGLEQSRDTIKDIIRNAIRKELGK